MFANAWSEITGDPVIRNWVRGVEIPFTTRPSQKQDPITPTWSEREQLLIQKQIDKLIAKGAIVRCSREKEQFLSNIFLTPKPDGSHRLILNLKKLNESVSTKHFKLEDWKVAKRLISPRNFLATIDLKDAYYLVPIAEKSRRFLRFSYGGELFEFTCLPFGLNIAPYIFTKILKPVAGFLRKRGFHSVFYLDDILVIGNSYERCMDNIRETSSLLQILGFVINEEKSLVVPTQRCKYLGLIFDSRKMSIELPEDKIQRTVDLLEKFSKIDHCKIREFASFVGTLISRCPALRYGMVYVRGFEKARLRMLEANGNNFDSTMSIPKNLDEDFEWWKANIRHASAPMNEPVYELEIFSDASRTGWGVFCEGHRSHGHWNVEDLESHINILELRAAFFGLKCFARHRRRTNILLRMDNTTAIAYVNRMRSSCYEDLSHLAKEIWQWCERREIWIAATYIRSSENVEADHESRRLQPETEFEIAKYAFEKIARSLGQPQIDLFASKANAKCRRYVSWRKDPDSIAIDAFTLEWKKWFFYAFPPFSIILRVLRKIENEGSNGIVVVPLWESQPWFPLFLSLLEAEPIILEPDIKLIRSSRREIHPLWQQLTLVAGKLSGKPSSGRKYQPNRWKF